ncbi:hypothetical protein XANCAGTX0491_002615 [Xanthoria calcicola]
MVMLSAIVALNLNLASLVLAGQVNLTSLPSFIGNPPEELGALAWHCLREEGHQLKTQDVAQAFRKIPNGPAPLVFTKTPAPGEGAVKVPVEFVAAGGTEFDVTTKDARSDVVSWREVRDAAALLLLNCRAAYGFHWDGVVENIGAAGLILVILRNPSSPEPAPNALAV